MATKIKLGNGNWGVKDGGTLAYNDENGVFKAIELASSRASGATYVSQSGLIADAEAGVPRIDWTNGVGELLLEPQRRNIVPTSDTTPQSNIQVVNTTNFGLSPDGANDSLKVQKNGFDQNDRIRPATSVVVSNGTNYSISAFFKNIDVVGTTTIGFRVTSGTLFRLGITWSGSVPSLDSGGVYSSGTRTNEILEDYGNGWYRIGFSFQSDGVSGNYEIDIDRENGTDTTSLESWGWQFEDGGLGVDADYVSSYIRTSGSAVTRIADAVTGNSSLGQVINSSEGVLYFEGSALFNDGTSRGIGLSDGSNNNRVFVYYDLGGTIKANRFLSTSGFASALTFTPTDITDVAKIAFKFKENDFALWVNGVEVDTESVGATFSSSTLDNLRLNTGGGSSPFYGRIRELKVYDTALTDAELTTLTTL